MNDAGTGPAFESGSRVILRLAVYDRGARRRNVLIQTSEYCRRRLDLPSRLVSANTVT